ncbi:MAG: ATP-binding protein [Fibrella sp.]|nr:ATP-binding protein [Armatimonadota bacterium]
MAILVGSKFSPFRHLLQRWEGSVPRQSFTSDKSIHQGSTQNILVTPVIVASIVVFALFLFIVAEGTVYYPLVPLVSLLTCFVITRFFSCTSGTLTALISITFLCFTGYFGSFRLPTEVARFTEVVLLTFGAIVCASYLRLAENKSVRLQEERLSLSAALIAVEQRRRGFVREVLASVTDQHLFICDSEEELPSPLSLMDMEKPLPLTPSALFHVRSRIRIAGARAGLATSVIEELVIAGSEAALNAVVHGENGTAEICVDTTSGRVQVWVRDEGTGIDDTLLHRATLERGFSSAGTLGQGFSLIVSTSHRVYLLTGDTGTTVVIESDRR